jgi:L-serine/L-threonine ammonia-lyase
MQDLHIKTPLVLSKPLSNLIRRDVYLKLENVQLCNSFKIRGISRLCQKRIEQGAKGFVIFSGGNAGITLAYTAALFKVPCYIVVPSFVSARILDRMRSYGAQITITQTAKDADLLATELVKKDPTLTLVHPYDDPELWNGYAELVQEVRDDLKGVKPGCFVTSVGGGGMLAGILTGLKQQGWEDVPVVAMETDGSHSLNKSVKAGHLVENVLTSIAKTLGANSVAPRVLEMIPNFRVISEILSDKEAVSACFKFADDHAFLVEPACGVTLATVYSKQLPNILKSHDMEDLEGPVILIVCGGQDTSIQILMEFAKQVGLDV